MGIAASNGRIEAAEIEVAAKIAGRIETAVFDMGWPQFLVLLVISVVLFVSPWHRSAVS